MNEHKTTEHDDIPFGIIIAGVGGQGILTISTLIINALLKSSYFVIQSEVHGMSQRGGSVSSQIQFSRSRLTSPLVCNGQGDLLVGLEPLETLRYIDFMKSEANIVSSICPLKNMKEYPDIRKLIRCLEGYENVHLIDQDSIEIIKLGNNSLNIFMLGASSNFLPVDPDVWKAVIKDKFSSRSNELIDRNIEFFETGREMIYNKLA